MNRWIKFFKRKRLKNKVRKSDSLLKCPQLFEGVFFLGMNFMFVSVFVTASVFLTSF